jgi:hypothetical protein
MDRNSTELINLSMTSLPIVEMLGTQQPWDETAVTAAPHWQRPHPVFGATLVRDLMLQRPLEMPPHMPPNDWRNAVASATQLIKTCQSPPNGDAVHALLNFAFEAIPYLRPAENAALMRSISSYACVTMLKDQERLWLNLMDAVGQRNGEGMTSAANALLAAGLDNTPARKRYLLAAGMLGNLSINRPAEAKKLWQNLSPQIFGTTPPPITFRIMAAAAGRL